MLHPSIAGELANIRAQELREAGARGRLERPAAPEATVEVVLRAARPEDRSDLRRLAALEGRQPVCEPAVVASVGGCVRAAVDRDGNVVGDPFAATEDLIALLRVRARQVGWAPRGGRLRLSRR